MSTVVFVLCAATSVVCAGLLWRGWRGSGARLLLWTSIGFVGFAINNVMLVIDELIVPERDLQLVRSASGFAAFAVLVFGFIWDVERDRQ